MIEFMEQAWAEARRGMLSGDGGPFGAVVVKDGQVIAAGHNQVLIGHDSTAHAEIAAIRKAEQALGTHDLTGCELYTTCYPCPMCLGAILWSRIRKVYYANTPEQAAAIGFDDKVFYDAIQDPEHSDMVELIHFNDKACEDLFLEWQNLANHQMY